jgi:GT2 family glycosyltransferase
MTITAIVPVWNGADLLRRLLASLGAQTLPAGEWLVVDNGSEDDAPEVARRAGARVVSMGRNAGFAAAVNRGIREARGECVAVLNSDVELDPAYFASLAARMEETGAWFATGKILAAGTDTRIGTRTQSDTPIAARIDATFDAVCRGGTAYRVGHGQTDGPAFSAPRSIWSAPWTAALFRAALFQKVGALEESFESYLEDVDFGLRCARHGLPGVYVPEALAWHRGSATLGRWHPETVRRIARNQLFLLARHFPARYLRRRAWAILVAQALWGAVALRHGAGLAWARGKWQGWHGFSTARNGAYRNSEPFAYEALDRLLSQNERSIREAQAAGVPDRYWSMYFLLSGSGAK